MSSIITPFKNGHLTALDSENLEEIVVEALRFALFVVRILPIFAESLGAAANFIPSQAHPACIPARPALGKGRLRVWAVADTPPPRPSPAHLPICTA